jgi:hypothetical protein
MTSLEIDAFVQGRLTPAQMSEALESLHGRLGTDFDTPEEWVNHILTAETQNLSRDEWDIRGALQTADIKQASPDRKTRVGQTPVIEAKTARGSLRLDPNNAILKKIAKAIVKLGTRSLNAKARDDIINDHALIWAVLIV